MSPLASRILRRMAAARRAIVGFEASNRYQEELQGFLLATLNYMEGIPRGAGQECELERWWRHVNVCGRALFSAEMAGKRARKVLKKLLG